MIKKVTFLFVINFMLLIILGFVSVKEINKLSALTNKLYEHPFTILNATRIIQTNLISMHRYMKDVSSAKNIDDIQNAKQKVDASRKIILEQFTVLFKKYLGDKKNIQKSYELFIQSKSIQNEVIALIQNNKPQEAFAITQAKGSKHIAKLDLEIDYLLSCAENKADLYYRNILKSEIKAKEFIITFLGIISLFSFLTFILLIQNLLKKDKEIHNYINTIEFNYKFERYTNNISKHLTYGKDIDICINSTLKELGMILNAHRSYLFLFKDDYAIVDNTHEWCSHGTKPEIDNLQNISAQSLSWWIQQCKDLKPMAIENMNSLPEEAKNEKQSFLKQDIKSLLVYPVIINKKSIGFVGIDMVHHHQIWTETHHSFVRLTAESIAIALEKKRYEQELQLSTKVFENSSEGIIITDAQTNILKVNDSFTKITGYSRDELIGQKPSILGSNWHDEKFYESMWKSLKKDSIWEGEIKDRRKSGELYVNLSTLIMIKNDDNKTTNYIGINRDITNVKKTQDHIMSLAYHDSLTQLPNRALFYDRLKQNIKYCERNEIKMAVLFIDLDNFKVVNDTHGHHTGDLLLQKVSTLLKDSIRTSDTVSRLGGDEFTVILSQINTKKDIQVLANKITTKLQEPILVNDLALQVGSSIGAAIYPDDTEDIDSLIEMADIAMYKAKNNGKNCLKFFEADDK
mgnify:CR=1 FL=1